MDLVMGRELLMDDGRIQFVVEVPPFLGLAGGKRIPPGAGQQNA